MRSHARIGNHPIHPMIVTIPIGAFFLSFLGDLLYVSRARVDDHFWYQYSYVCMAVGIAFALVAAVVGAIDYFRVRMSAKAFRTATRHAVVNLSLVALYGASFLLRRNEAAAAAGTRWAEAMSLSTLAFLALGVAGWLGGKLAFELRVGVLEDDELRDRSTLAGAAPRLGSSAHAQRS